MSDYSNMLAEFGQNVAILIALIYAYSFITHKLSDISNNYRSAVQGILFGIIAVIGMQIPMHVADGIIVDGRTVIVMLASPFGGPIAGFVAGGIVSLFRLYLGGIGTMAGIGAILTAMVIGIGFSRVFSLSPSKINSKHLIVMAGVMTFISLLWVFSLPAHIDAFAIFKRLLIPVAFMYPLASILLGYSLAHEYRRFELIEAVKDSEARFKGLFDNAGVSIWNEDLSRIWGAFEDLRNAGVSDLGAYLQSNEGAARKLAKQVKVRAINKATLKLFGATSESEFLGRIDTTFGPDAVSVFSEELKAIWTKQKMFYSEANFQRLDGGPLSLIITFQIPTTREGFKSIFVSLIDVTERRRLEEKIRHTQKMDALGQLTGGIAHDFNNLLGIIQGNLELLEEKTKDDQQITRHIATAQRSVTRGADMTKKLLDFSRKDVEQPQLIPLNSFILSLEDLIAKSLTASIIVETQLEKDLWPIAADPGDLENALLNLAINARDAMPGGGSLVISTTNQVLTDLFLRKHPTAKAGEYVSIAIADSGMGITDEIREKILEPFFTTKEVGKGTGLGLSMVYGFVQRSGGLLNIDSKSGKGTTITLFLPRLKENEKDLDILPKIQQDYSSSVGAKNLHY